jgi:predicted nuclease of predicted toxin-antitoxin system
VKGILADINIQGHMDVLMKIARAEPWKLFWDDLRLQYLHFSDVGLAQASLDSLVWDTCQRHELVLLTDNRNENDPDSLEATIRARNSPASFPVVTIGNVPHLRQSRAYADRIIDKLFDFLMRMDSLRGTGRLYVP